MQAFVSDFGIAAGASRRVHMKTGNLSADGLMLSGHPRRKAVVVRVGATVHELADDPMATFAAG